MTSSDFSAGSLDDGRGLARVALFRHKHEIETGRTSSVGMEVNLGDFGRLHQTDLHVVDSRIRHQWAANTLKCCRLK